MKKNNIASKVMKKSLLGDPREAKRLWSQQIQVGLDHAFPFVSELDIKFLVSSVLLVGIL